MMKSKHILISVGALFISFVFLLSSCTYTPTTFENSESSSEVEKHVQDHEKLTDAEYANLFPSFYYSSWKELYMGLKNISEEELSDIRNLENRFIDDTCEVTYVSEEREQRNGIFESMREQMLENTEMLLPYYQNQPLPLNNEYEYSLELSVADTARKPWISCYTTLGIGFRMMFCDPDLVDKANEKGASWLLSVLEPDAMNVYNYEEIRDKVVSDGTLPDYNVVVYEKEYKL